MTDRRPGRLLRLPQPLATGIFDTYVGQFGELAWSGNALRGYDFAGQPVKFLQSSGELYSDAEKLALRLGLGIDISQGVVGIQGQTGAVGPVGPTGPAGKDGANGPIGPAGKDGSIGPQGNDGVQGLRGPAGPPVDPASLATVLQAAFKLLRAQLPTVPPPQPDTLWVNNGVLEFTPSA